MFIFTFDSVTVNEHTFPAEYSVTPSGKVIVFMTIKTETEEIKKRMPIEVGSEFYAAAYAAATGKAVESAPESTETDSSADSGASDDPVVESVPESVPEQPETVENGENAAESDENDEPDAKDALIDQYESEIASLRDEIIAKDKEIASVHIEIDELRRQIENLTKTAVPAAPAVVESPKSAEKPYEIIEDESISRVRIVLKDATDAMKQIVIDGGFFWSNATKSYHKRLNSKGKAAAAEIAAKLDAMIA